MGNLEQMRYLKLKIAPFFIKTSIYDNDIKRNSLRNEFITKYSKKSD